MFMKMRWFAFALCLVSVPLVAQQQAADASNIDDDYDGPPSVNVSLRAKPHGDVEIELFAQNLESLRAPVDLLAILRGALPCDWRPAPSSIPVGSHRLSATTPGVSRQPFEPAPDYIAGTCRRLLHGAHGVVDDNISLAPLVAALHQAGISEVELTLNSLGEPAPSPGARQWFQPAPRKRPAKSLLAPNWQFWSFSQAGALPPAFHVRLGTEWTPNRLIARLVFVLFCPALLSFWLRLRRQRKKLPPGAGMVWLNWILLGSWLYWISFVGLDDIAGFTGALEIESSLLSILLGAVLFSMPPLVAMAVSFLALAPQTQTQTSERVSTVSLLWRTLAGTASFIVPLGLFIAGTSLAEQDWRAGMLSVMAAYAAYRILAWSSWRFTSARMRALDTGELRARASTLAQASQVQLKSVHILDNRFPSEANAFAMSGGRISLTRGLIDHMSRREVDAVLAHEVGHLGGKHIGMRTLLLVAYIAVIGPAATFIMSKAGLPEWAMMIPIAPFLYILAAGQLSQSHELNADSRAVQLTNDPEATIAALSRLAKLTQSPVDWGGIQGSILSHPSMRRRVLSIARRFGVPEPRALELLDHPDALGTDPAHPDRYPLPAHFQNAAPVFSSTAKISHSYWATWVLGGTLVALLMAAAFLLSQNRMDFGLQGLAFLISLPAVAWLTLQVDERWDHSFIAGMKRRIAGQSARTPDGVFVALLPGDQVFPIEGVYAWDLGMLTLEPDRLSFRGEQARFSVPRADVQSIEIRRGPFWWHRTYAVVLRCSSAVFSVRFADRGRSRRLAKRLATRLNSWGRGESFDPAGSAEPLPPPDLPLIRPVTASRLRLLWAVALRTGLLFFGVMLLTIAWPVFQRNPLFAFIPIVAPFIYAVILSPMVLRPQS